VVEEQLNFETQLSVDLAGKPFSFLNASFFEFQIYRLCFAIKRLRDTNNQSGRIQIFRNRTGLLWAERLRGSFSGMSFAYRASILWPVGP
jgi:hypothetical protein